MARIIRRLVLWVVLLVVAPAGNVFAERYVLQDGHLLGVVRAGINANFAELYNLSSFSITSGDKSNWNAAYSWGDHALAGYLTSYAETDPVFSTSVAAEITAQQVAEWGQAYQWGDHSLAGYLTAISGLESVFDGWDKNAGDDFSGNWSDLLGTPTTLAGYGITDAEPSLGNPPVDGYLLSSTAAGARIWVAPGGGALPVQSDCLTILSGCCLDSDDGSLYCWDGAAVQLVAQPNPFIPVVTNPAMGQIMKFDGSNWVNDTDDTGSGTLPSGSAINDILQWNGTVWVAQGQIDGLINDSAGDEDINSVWSADKVFAELAQKAGISHDHDGVYQPLDPDLSAIAALECPDGQIPKRVSGVWACADDGGGGSLSWGAIVGSLSDQSDLQAALDAKEPSLGNPPVDGYLLSSTTAGARSWVAPGSGSFNPSAPGPIGDVTPSTGVFTELTAESIDFGEPDPGEVGQVGLREDPTNGTNVVTLEADSDLPADVVIPFPSGVLRPGNNLNELADKVASRAALGVTIGTHVQAYDDDLSDLADGSLTGSKVGSGIPAGNVTTGTLPDAVIPTSIARDTELPLPVSAPATASDSCTAGQWSYDASYHYVCVAADTWARVALSTW